MIELPVGCGLAFTATKCVDRTFRDISLTQDKILSSVGFGGLPIRSPTQRRRQAKEGIAAVRITDVHDPVAAVVTAALAASVGASVCPSLARRGLHHIEATVDCRRLRLVGFPAGATAGVAAAFVTRHAGSWWLLPAALAWTYTLAVAALCDAFTQRIPTAVVRQGAVTTGVFVIAASAAAARWNWALLAAVGAISASLIFGFCRRFLGVGYGDVRIAIVGGLGLVQPTYVGIAAGIGAFTLITLIQAGAVLARGGNRRTLFPYGPAIAAAFVVAGLA